MRLPRPSGAATAAVALLVGAAVIRGTTAPSDPGGLVLPGSPSALNRDPEGTRILHLAVERLGIPVAVTGESPVALAPRSGPLVVALPPDASRLSNTLVQLARFVEEGGRLLVAFPGGSDPFTASMGGLARRVPLVVEGRASPVPGTGLGDRGPLAPTRWALDPASLAADARVLVEVDAGAQTLPWVAEIAHGAGTAIVLADGALLSNASLREEGAALLAVRLVQRAADGRRAVFYENPHGMVTGGSMFGALWRALVGTPAGNATLHAAAAALLLLIAGWPRLGRVRRFVAPPRRSSTAHGDAVAGLFLGAGKDAWPVVGRLLLAGLRRRSGLGTARADAPEAASAVGRRLAWDRPADAERLAADARDLARSADPRAMAVALARLDAAIARRPGTGARARATAARA